MIPVRLRELIEQNLASPVTEAVPLSGGDINQAARVTTANGQILFLKWHSQAPAGMFAAEAYGLELLASAGGARVPAVYFQADDCLALEWLGPIKRGGPAEAARLGEDLARQHHAAAPFFGLKMDNYCGLTRQINTPADNWPAFFGRNRLGYQMELAHTQGRMSAPRRRNLERLIARLPELLPAAPAASLLHGDLWGGNWLVSGDGRPALIDPAVYYGHREADIAFTELFGGFPAEFYRAYQSAWPLEPGYRERRDIYNLYHLLNHLNLFGGGYGSGVDAVLNRHGK